MKLTIIARDFHRWPSPHVALHDVRFHSVTSQSIFSFTLGYSELTSEYDCRPLLIFPVDERKTVSDNERHKSHYIKSLRAHVC